jgi:hypothetical protein
VLELLATICVFQIRSASSNLLSPRSNVPNGKWPALRAINLYAPASAGRVSEAQVFPVRESVPHTAETSVDVRVKGLKPISK